MMPRTVSAVRISRTSSAWGLEVTCLPSPGGRLSRPRTTTETPLPWGSPPEGQSRAALNRHVVARFRSSTHPYARTRCPMSHPRATDEPGETSPSSAATLTSIVAGGSGHQPGLDFKQDSLDHAARALRSEPTAGGLLLRFSGRLCSPWPRRLRVSRMAQDTLPEYLPFCERDENQPTRRTASRAHLCFTRRLAFTATSPLIPGQPA